MNRVFRSLFARPTASPGARAHRSSSPIEEVYEPYLIQLGFLNRTPRGRTATDLAFDYFQVKPKLRREDQPPLF